MLSRAFTFPRWRLGTCSIKMLRMSGRVQLAQAFLTRCAARRTPIRGPALVGRNAIKTSSPMSAARVSSVTGTFPHLPPTAMVTLITMHVPVWPRLRGESE